MTKREASRETLERLAEAYHHAQDPRGSSKRETRLEDAYRCWLEETAPRLRTRAEVDAEIATIMRRVDAEARAAGGWGFGHRRLGDENRVGELCSEPTAPEETP